MAAAKQMRVVAGHELDLTRAADRLLQQILFGITRGGLMRDGVSFQVGEVEE